MARAGSRQPSLLCRSYGASGEEIASLDADVNRPMEAHAEVAAAPAKRPEPIRDGPRHGHDVDRRCRDEPVERARRRHCARARANDADPDFSRSCADGVACGDGAPNRGMDRPTAHRGLWVALSPSRGKAMSLFWHGLVAFRANDRRVQHPIERVEVAENHGIYDNRRRPTGGHSNGTSAAGPQPRAFGLGRRHDRPSSSNCLHVDVISGSISPLILQHLG